MFFGLCNVLKTFPCLMNKVFELFLGLFLQVFIDDFIVYNDRTFHLAKVRLVFQCLDRSKVILRPKKTIIDFSKRKMVEHIVSMDGVAINLEKFYKISKFPFSTILKSLVKQ
jgi:hypothetical protein